MKRKGAKCPAEVTLGVIGGRWKAPILWQLFQGVKRFSELSRALNGITQKMLTQHVREMERDGIIHRKVYAQGPPEVEYSLTGVGESLKPVVDSMCRWGVLHRNTEVEHGGWQATTSARIAKPAEHRAQRE